MFSGDQLVANLGGGLGGGASFEFFGEGLVVEEGPWVIEFRVEGAFEVAHGYEEVFKLLVSDERDDGGVDAVGIGIVRGIVVAVYSP